MILEHYPKISTVGSYAFENCTKLRTLYVPAMLPKAFNVHPDMWETIHAYTTGRFANCSLATITISDGVKEAFISVVDNAANNFDTAYSLARRAAGTYIWDTTNKWWKIYIPATGETIYTQNGSVIPVEADE